MRKPSYDYLQVDGDQAVEERSESMNTDGAIQDDANQQEQSALSTRDKVEKRPTSVNLPDNILDVIAEKEKE